MSFTNLPAEVLLNIADFLLPTELLTFAHLNSLAYQSAHKLLHPILAHQRNRKEMIRRFGPPHRHVGHGRTDQAICLATSTDLIDIYNMGADTVTYLEHFRMDGDLHWLKPLPESIMAEHDWPRGDAANREHLDSILDAATRMGVELPKGFTDFIGSQQNIDFMFLGGDFFQLAPSVVECLGVDDKNGEGFVIRFMCDQQWCGFWALYVAPGGYHCILGLVDDTIDWSDEEIENESDGNQALENEAGHEKPAQSDLTVSLNENQGKRRTSPGLFTDIPLATRPMRPSLVHTDFEEWLCMRYFDGWISATLEADEELDPHQKKYLEHVWLYVQATIDHQEPSETSFGSP